MSEFLRAVKPLVPLIPIGLAAVAVATTALAVWRSRGSGDRTAAWWSAMRDVGLVASLLAIGVLTLPPSIESTRSVEWIPFSGSGGSVRATERAANVLLFIPAGFFAPLRWHRLDTFPRMALAGASLSVVIEVLQFALALGRQSSTTDVVLNTFGAVLGYAVLRTGRLTLRTRRAQGS